MHADGRGLPVRGTKRGEGPNVVHGTDAWDWGSTGQWPHEGKEGEGGSEAAGWATAVRLIFKPKLDGWPTMPDDEGAFSGARGLRS